MLLILKELELLDDPISNYTSNVDICSRVEVSKTFLYEYPDKLAEPINDAIRIKNFKMRNIVQKQFLLKLSMDRLLNH